MAAPRLHSFVAVGLLAVGLLVASATAPSTAASSAASAPTGSSGARSAPVVVRLCPAARPGHATCLAERRLDVAVQAQRAGVGTSRPSGYGPADLAAAYGLNRQAGSGRTVAVVDAYDDPFIESELATYRSRFGLPRCTVANRCLRKVNQHGALHPLPARNRGWAGEMALDLQMVSA